MKFLITLCLIFTAQLLVQGQLVYQGQMMQNTVYSDAPDELKHSKPFIREWQFWETRAYPDGYIPDNAYLKSIEQRSALRETNRLYNDNITWVSLGPTPGAYFNYGSISSRIVTGTFHPVNTDIIYVGPANGGVWKTTNGGTNWTPLTDNQPSMSMGCIVLDPVNPEIVYAGTGEATYSGASYYGAGLLKSTDGGASWTHITAGLPTFTYFSRIVVRPGHNNELLAALGTAGLYKSTNAGLNWSQLVAGRCDDVLFSQTGDTAFCVGSGTGLRRSIDGGATFTVFGTGLATGVRTHFDYGKSNPAIMFAAVHSSGLVRIYKSTNYGADWTVALPSLDGGGQAWYDLYCKVNPANPEIAYIGAIDVFRTTNGGFTFNNITNGYAGGSVHVDQHFLFFHPTIPTTFIVCNDGGIYKTTNNGDSFTNMNQGLTLTQFYRIAASPHNPSMIMGGTQDNGTQLTTGAINWYAAFGGDGGEVCYNPFNQNYILGESQNGYLVRTTNGGANWDNATTGIDMGESGSWVAPIIAHPTTDGTFYVARRKLYKSTNNGANWTAVSANIGSGSIRELAISYSNPSMIYASSGSILYKSTDGGATWSSSGSGLPSKTITSINIHPQNPDVAVISVSGFGTNKIWKTTSAGASWFSISAGLPDSPGNDALIYTWDPANPNTYFAALDNGVYYTRDNGATWTETFENLPNTVIIHLDYAPTTHTLRAGTHGRGVYEAYIDFYLPVELVSFTASRDLDGVVLNWSTATEINNRGFEIERKLKSQDWQTVGFVSGNGTVSETQEYTFTDDISLLSYDGRILYRLKQIDFDGTSEYSEIIYIDVNMLPAGITLYQNYPNPFNPSTAIKYFIVEESNVKLSIFNSLGEKIHTLVNEVQNFGYHQINWNASDLASGVYLYSIEVSDLKGNVTFKDSKKLILTK